MSKEITICATNFGYYHSEVFGFGQDCREALKALSALWKKSVPVGRLVTLIFLSMASRLVGDSAVPVIKSQPVSQVISAGNAATFNVTATGDTLAYQWWFNGTRILAGTNASCTIPNAQASNAGNYQVSVSNVAGSAKSYVVTLTVSAPVLSDPTTPAIATQPVKQIATAGSQATFSVTATGNNLAYQWWFNGTRIPAGTNSICTITNVQEINAGNYQVVVSNGGGSVKSGIVSLAVVAPAPSVYNTQSLTDLVAPVIETQPTRQTATAGTSATFSVTATGTDLAYQWWFSGVKCTGATSANFTITNVQDINAGNYQVVVSNGGGSVKSGVVTLTVVAPAPSVYDTQQSADLDAPVIAIQPTRQTVTAGTSAAFSVTATGTGLAYQWWFNGVKCPGATNAACTIANAQDINGGNYQVVVSNGSGSVKSVVVNLTVIDSPPVITAQPQNLSVPLGGTTALSVVASGNNLTYQWWFNGVKCPAATNANCTIANVQEINAGNYQVVVANGGGSVKSAIVNVTVTDPPPVIAVQPQSLNVSIGSTATLYTIATGNHLTYQWWSNGTRIPNGTNATCSLVNFQSSNAGNYQVAVSNGGGVARSAVVAVTINTPPVISQIDDQTVLENAQVGPLSFTVGDSQTPAANLTLTASSSDTSLVPNENIHLAGTGTNRTVRVIPATNQFGSCAIALTVSDPDGGKTTRNFTVTVSYVNQPPKFVGIVTPIIAQPYQFFSYTVSVADPDPGDSLTVRALQLPAWLSFDPERGVLSGTPPPGGPEGDAVTLSVDDGVNPALIQQFRIWTADFIAISSAADIEGKRQALINYIWGADGWPTNRMPASVQSDIADPVYASLYNNEGNLSRIDLYTVRMAYGMESKVYHFHPRQGNGRLFVFHAGHEWQGFEGDDVLMNNATNCPGLVIPALLKEGYSVLALSMPIYNPDGMPAVSVPWSSTPVTLHNHGEMLAYLDRPFRFFLEPIAVALNMVQDSYAYKNIYMTGLSGGGWTTTVYAALDTRIERSFPVAGSVPNYLRVGYEGLGDAEQEHPVFYRIANYEELYVMGSSGAGRVQTQILNLYDSCCFYGMRYTNWVDKVKSKVQELGTGTYDFFSDTTHNEHKTSPTALSLILDLLPPTFDSIADMTIDANSGRQAVRVTGIRAATFSRPNELILTAMSDNPSLVGDIAIAYTSPDAAGSLSFSPQENAFGTATITVTLDDGQSSQSFITRTFKITVNPP